MAEEKKTAVKKTAAPKEVKTEVKAVKAAPAKAEKPVAKPAAKPTVAKAEKPAKEVKAAPVKEVKTAPKAEVKAAPAKVEAPAKAVKAEVKPEVVAPVAKPVSAPVKVKGAKSKPGQTISTGRRKSSVARVRLYAGGSGKITINDVDIDKYLNLETLKLIVRQPLVLTGNANKYDVIVNVYGGGQSGQAGAIRHGIARALLKESETYRLELKKAGFLTRDSRMKERKKYGLKGARRAPQFSKR